MSNSDKNIHDHEDHHSDLSYPPEFPVNLLPELRRCVALCHQCGAIARDRRSKLQSTDISKKTDGSFVTEVDKQLNAICVNGLRTAFPDDVVVSEESECEKPTHLQNPTGMERTWFVDPIDGTADYVRGDGEWCVMIGLCEQGRPILGVIFEGDSQILYVGVTTESLKLSFRIKEKGKPFERIHCSLNAPEKSRIVVSRSKYSRHVLNIAKNAGIVLPGVPCGSFGVKCCRIASGSDGEVYLNLSGCTSFWDTCAVEPILNGAGGRLVPMLETTTKPVPADDHLIRYNFVHQMGTNIPFRMFASTDTLVDPIRDAFLLEYPGLKRVEYHR